MLKSYEAIYENGRVIWVDEQPPLTSARLIVTVLEEKPIPPVKRRTFPTTLAGKVEILGDIISPIVDEADWECLSHAEDLYNDPLLGQFLNFLGRDLHQNPQHLQSISSDLVNRIQALVAGVDIDLDAPLADELEDEEEK